MLFIRDMLLFSSLMDNYDWNIKIKVQEPNWIPKGVSEQAVKDIIEKDNLYTLDDPEIAIDKVYTLNFWYHPEDKLFLESEERRKKKKESVTTHKKEKDSVPVMQQNPKLYPIKDLPPVDLSIQLLREFSAFLSDYVQETTQLKEAKKDPRYGEISVRLSRLQLVDVSQMNDAQKKAFFINIFHILILHISTIVGAPNNSIRRALYFSTFRYQIGREHYTLNDIKHGILRGNQDPIKSGGSYFSRGDPRKNHTQTLDPRIHGALCYFTQTGPLLREYKEESLEAMLTQEFQEFLFRHVNIDLKTMKVTLPITIKWYRSDMKKEDEDKKSLDFENLVIFLEDNSPGELKYNLNELNLDVDPLVEYTPYNWAHKFDFNAINKAQIVLPIDSETHIENNDTTGGDTSTTNNTNN